MSPTDSRLRVGVVGAGENTVKHHIPKLRAIPGVEITAVCNRSRASSERVAAEWDIPTVHDDWLALVSDPGIDAVVIGTWPNMHHPVTVAALAADKHVLCEARMAMNAVEARDMRDASRARPHLVTQVVPSPLSFGVDATISRLVSSGHLGDLVAVDIQAHEGGFPDPGAALHWREDADRSGHNIMTMGIWYESLMRWVGEATDVTAVGKVTVRSRKDETGTLRPIRIPDHLDVIAQMACGAQARLQVSNVAGPIRSRHATLIGHDGILRFENGGLFGGRRGDDELHSIDVPADEAGYWRVEEEFVNAIRGIETVRLTDFDAGVKYMEFTDAVWGSMQHRVTVPLPAA
jgi:predicted dehydrogenase